jgi:DNA-binding CsgD family transcriptional regulator
MVGRRSELELLRLALDDAVEGHGRTVFVTGDVGVGKTRLVQQLSQEAARREMLVASGSAYAAESGVPYGIISDALVPVLRALPPGALTVLARGTERELGTILHGLPIGREPAAPASADEDRKARLLWAFAQFLGRLAERQPLLLVMENAHWGDASSLELLHFLARQLRHFSILLLVTWADEGRELPSALRMLERSLTGRGEATLRRLPPLSRTDVRDLLVRTFELSGEGTTALAERLHERTGGNPLFVDQLVRHLMAVGAITWDGGRWQLAEVADLGFPATIREALDERLAALDPSARRVADAASVLGSRAPLPLLHAVSGLAPHPFADAVEVLCAQRILREVEEGAVPQYAFVHPLMQLTVEGAVSAARRRALHLAAAEALEQSHGGPGAIGARGETDPALAGELARHLLEASEPGHDARTLRYVMTAGRDALDRHADAEALRLLGEALAIAQRLKPGERVPGEYAALLEDLARARQRTGDAAGARQLLEQALALARERGDALAVSHLLRRLGLAAAFGGNHADGLALLRESEEAARAGGRDDLAVRVRVDIGMLLQALGEVQEAKRQVAAVLPRAEALGDHAALARVHRALLQLHGWSGEVEAARAHGAAALTHAASSGDRVLAWYAHWGLAAIAGLTGDHDGVARHRVEAERLVRELGSPLLQVHTAEIAIEYASAVGDWSEGVARAEKAIPLARAVAPNTVLPRLLVWTGLIRIQQDEPERGHALLQEAWVLTRAESVEAAVREGRAPVTGDMNSVILAHTGMAAWHLSQREWVAALDYGQRGVALADRFGLVVWTIHRLLPIVLEAALWLQDYALVRQATARLRAQSLAMKHKLGMAWADAAEALRLRLEEQHPDTVSALLSAAAALEAVPFPFHAARLRRNAAQVMALDGDLEGARRELRIAHDVFSRLGAEYELRGTRSELRSLGVRPPPRTVSEGAFSLTGRELDIARLVAERLTNKEIAQRLDISARTVSTHLSNIFGKLGVESRGELVDRLRERPGFLAGGEG